MPIRLFYFLGKVRTDGFAVCCKHAKAQHSDGIRETGKQRQKIPLASRPSHVSLTDRNSLEYKFAVVAFVFLALTSVYFLFIELTLCSHRTLCPAKSRNIWCFSPSPGLLPTISPKVVNNKMLIATAPPAARVNINFLVLAHIRCVCVAAAVVEMARREKEPLIHINCVRCAIALALVREYPGCGSS